MFSFQIWAARPPTSQQNLPLVLDTLIREVDRNPQHWVPSTVKIPGLNRCASPFSRQFEQCMSAAGLLFDDVNYCWYKRVNHLEEAEQLRTWFEQNFRPWYAGSSPQAAQELQIIQSRTMDEPDEIAGLRTF